MFGGRIINVNVSCALKNHEIIVLSRVHIPGAFHGHGVILYGPWRNTICGVNDSIYAVNFRNIRRNHFIKMNSGCATKHAQWDDTIKYAAHDDLFVFLSLNYL